MLAMAIFIEKYKKGASDNAKDKIEVVWLAKWKGDLVNPTRNPCHVMKAYLDLLDTTVEDMDDQMCWNCWPEDDGLRKLDNTF